MKLIYIAGPYRADSQYETAQNIARARKAAEAVWALGGAALCPHLNSAWMSGLGPEGMFLRGYLELLRRCDAILVLADSDDSVGTQNELALAHTLGMPVFEIESDSVSDSVWTDLMDWLNKDDGA